MKGLIRHNIYSVADKMKLTIIINVIVTLAFAMVGMFNKVVYSWAAVVILLQISIYAVQAVSTLQTDANSQWNKFEITMPVRRKDVIGARYIGFILCGIVGIITTLVTIGVFYLFQTNVNFERVIFSVTFGVVLLLLVPALTHPLLLIFGIDKSETMSVISIFAATVLYVGSSMLFNLVLPDLSNGDLIFRGMIIIISGILFAISYVISKQLYQKRELN
ncbi:MAG: ABC-2 transporter permease [Lachnospiraceae bacterium]|nr:ABC-2 transporter permease [Lachnospiraceae bacterium]